MAYIDVVGPHLGPGFVYSELVKRGSPRHVLPPEKWWPRMVRPLQLANLLRSRMLERGARGLRIQAAFRPLGGALASQHKTNRALDLDLLPEDYELAGAYAEEAVRLLCEMAPTESLGVGIYGRRKTYRTIRVHLDVGKHAERDRGWQISGRNEYPMHDSDMLAIAERLGLTLP
jgi:hypothetical protein